MFQTGERAYAYAKACGVIGKSFIGKRALPLRSADRLSALDRLVFGGGSRDLPERELLPDLETRIALRAVSAIRAVISCFRSPPEALVLLLRAAEYNDLRNCIAAFLAGETAKTPRFTDMGPFRVLKIDKWPDLPAMIADTEFAFLLDKDGKLTRTASDATALQSALDLRYYTALWQALQKLPRRDRRVSQDLLAKEISLLNAAWVLRLRTYYEMEVAELAKLLCRVPEGASGRKSFAAEAEAALVLPLDSRQPWAAWRWQGFLNAETPGEAWAADPRFFQNAAARYLYRQARRAFHVHPLSMDTFFCFIKLKQFEEDLLTSSAEGLGLGLSSAEVSALLEVQG
ncbi:MAG: V-type ATPase subunit [Treponema sp.]|jgi:vacuolar-type H+-ATPase subunit C/Vma6|nr:V-type ATPase subunit [Treponema sp.]